MGAKGEFKKNVIYICVVGFIHNNLILKINSSKKYIFFYSIGNIKKKKTFGIKFIIWKLYSAALLNL